MIGDRNTGAGARLAQAGLGLLLAVGLLTTTAGRAAACDLCAVYTGTLMREDRTGPWLGVGQQYSSLGTVQDDGHRVSNPHDEYVGSSTTQVVVGYALTHELALQASLPLVSREYRRLEDGIATRGDQKGAGDLAFLARLTPFSRNVGDVLVHFDLLAGVKLPTGDSSRLAEEHDEALEVESGPALDASLPGGGGRHTAHASAVHGHDLVFGTGSVDGVFGLNFHANWKRLFASGWFQYALRGASPHDYSFADDVTWEVGPGVYPLLHPLFTGAVRLVASGEYKGEDREGGVAMDDTAITSVYLGPGLSFTWKDLLLAQCTVDLPVAQDTSGLQIVADYRIRAGLAWHF